MRGKSSPASFESTVPCPGLRVAAVPLDEEHDQERHEDRDRGEEDGHQSPPSLDDRGPGVRAHPGSTPIAVGREPLFTEAPGRSAGSASRTTAAACSPARYPHSERHHKARHGGRSVALIPSAPCVQTHRRVSSATPAPPATGVRLALSPKAAPEDLPPRSWVASAPTCSLRPGCPKRRGAAIPVSMAFYSLTTSTGRAVRFLSPGTDVPVKTTARGLRASPACVAVGSRWSLAGVSVVLVVRSRSSVAIRGTWVTQPIARVGLAQSIGLAIVRRSVTTVRPGSWCTWRRGCRSGS